MQALFDAINEKIGTDLACPFCNGTWHRGAHRATEYFKHENGCPVAEMVDDKVVFGEYMELHPAGTRERIAALEAERVKLRAWAHIWKRKTKFDRAILKLRTQSFERRGKLIKKLADERDDLRTQVAQQHATIGTLLDLLRVGAGDDSPEYAKALVEVGAVPASDVSDPTWGGLDAIPFDHADHESE